MKKIIFLILFLLLSICKVYSLEDRVVAVVNNEVITEAELDIYVKLFKLQFGEDYWTQHGMTDRAALENLIEDRLIVQEAKAKKIEIPDRLIDSKIKRIKSQFDREDEFLDYLSVQGLSLAELKERFKEQLLSDELIEREVRNKIFISPKEVTEYYEQHTEQFNISERVEVESIFVNEENLANEIYNKLKNGVDFSQLQTEYSKRSNLGLITKGQLLKEIEDVIFSLEIGKFSQPVEAKEGYYIFLIKDRLPAQKRALSEVSKDIFNLISEEKFNIRLKMLIEKLKEKAYIVIKDK